MQVKSQVVVDEAGDKVIAVIIALTAVQFQMISARFRRCLQCFRLQLLLKKPVSLALVHQRRHGSGGVAHQQTRVVGGPSGGVLAQVGGKGFLPPRAVHRVADRAEGRDRLETLGIAQGQNQCAVPPHRVAEDRPLVADRKTAGAAEYVQGLHYFPPAIIMLLGKSVLL